MIRNRESVYLCKRERLRTFEETIRKDKSMCESVWPSDERYIGDVSR